LATSFIDKAFTGTNLMKDSSKPLIIVGAGGFASEGAWVTEDINAVNIKQGKGKVWDLLGFAVFDPPAFPSQIYSYPVLGAIEEVACKFAGADVHFVCMIGDNRIRREQAQAAEGVGWTAAVLVHPSVQAARDISVGRGSYVGAGSILSPFSAIGMHVVVNQHVTVGHDSLMHDFSQACPGSRISGHCIVGRSALLGSNSVLMPGCHVGDRAIVGAGSVAMRRVEAGTTVVGVPARAMPGMEPIEKTA